jgi:hypothetical protein
VLLFIVTTTGANAGKTSALDENTRTFGRDRIDFQCAGS